MMDIAEALTSLAGLVGYDTALKQELLRYNYVAGDGTTYILSPDYASFNCDCSVVAKHFQEKIAIDGNASKESRAARFTAYLLAALVSNNQHVLLVLSQASNASRSVCNDAALAEVFDHIVMLQSNVPDRDGLDERQLREMNVIVGFGCSPAEIEALFDRTSLPPRGVVVYHKGFSPGLLFVRAPRPVSILDLNVDLGDGPAVAAYWGQAK